MFVSNLRQGEVKNEATFAKGSILWRTEDGYGGCYGDLDDVSAFTDTHASRSLVHDQSRKLFLALSLLRPCAHNIVFGLGRAVNLKAKIFGSIPEEII